MDRLNHARAKDLLIKINDANELIDMFKEKGPPIGVGFYYEEASRCFYYTRHGLLLDIMQDVLKITVNIRDKLEKDFEDL